MIKSLLKDLLQQSALHARITSCHHYFCTGNNAPNTGLIVSQPTRIVKVVNP